MDATYWINRWHEGRTGWHNAHVSPVLKYYWPSLSVPDGTRVLVPLCGKTLDMLWLAEQGLRVLGVEVAPLAVDAFFSDNGLTPERYSTADGTAHVAGNITILCTSVFSVGVEMLGTCGAVYDRGAIVAQPPDERRQYASHVYSALPAKTRGLMMTVEYPQNEMAGPPFSVPEAELDSLLGRNWTVTLAERRDLTRDPGGPGGAQLSAFSSAVYKLDR